MPRIELETSIQITDIKRVFDHCRSIDLHILSTERSNEKAIAGKTSGLISLGETVTWKAKHLGIYQTLTSIVTDCDSPTFFADEMVKGAFKSFRHEHYFSQRDEFVIIKDIFEYKSPLGILGKLADFLFLENYMKRFLLERNQVVKKYAESDLWKNILPS